MIPCAPSMATCAFEPARSSAARRLSKPIDTLIACIRAPGLAEKRPPHRECPSVSDLGDDMERLMARLDGRWGAIALGGLAAALYVIPGCTAKPSGDLKSLAQGQMKSLVLDDAPSPAPSTQFLDAAGKPHTLAEFKGKAVIVNLWATWCAPCVEEMPTLAKLAQTSAGQALVVVPISLD